MRLGCLLTRVLLVLSLALSAFALKTREPYKDASLPISVRVSDLLKRMTVEEKINQLIVIVHEFSSNVTNQYGKVGLGYHKPSFQENTVNDVRTIIETRNKVQGYFLNNSRLAIPVCFYNEVLHAGAIAQGTIFPMPVGMGASWNVSLIHSIYDIVGLEAAATGNNLGFGPVLNLFTDPRFGRIEEGFTEDPVLLRHYASAATLGLQGGKNDPSDYVPEGYIVALAKHFAAYGQTQGGLNGSPADLSLAKLHQLYLRPWETFFSAGGRGIMVAHNTINGVPCHADPMLLKDILRKQYNFTGVTMSDQNDVPNLINFNIAATMEDAASLAINNGVDIDLGGNAFPNLQDAVAQGKVSVSTLDAAVTRSLTQKFASGVFDKPYADTSKVNELDNPKRRKLAFEAAQQAIVLLKKRRSTTYELWKR